MTNIVIAISYICLGLVLVFMKEGIHAALIGVDIMKNMKRNHHLIWSQLTTFGSSGPGFANPFRFIPWLIKHHDELIEDKILKSLCDALRLHYKRLSILAVAIMLCLFIAILFSLIFL